MASSGPAHPVARRGGELRVAATEAISILGRGSVDPQTGLFSVTNASADAGRLFVSAPTLAKTLS